MGYLGGVLGVIYTHTLMQTRGTATTPHRLYSDPDEGPCARVSEPSLGGDQGPYKEATCTVRPGWPNEHGSYKSRTHTVEDLSGSLTITEYFLQPSEVRQEYKTV